MGHRSAACWTIAFMFMVVAVAPAASQAAETADVKFVDAAASDAYTEIAKAWGLDLRFDPGFRGMERVTLEMDDVTALEALEALAHSGGHRIAAQDGGGLIVFNDTHQNRREYEPLVMATFAPSYIPAKDVDKLLRSLIEARRIAVNEQLQTVTMRDTAAKICVARRLLEVFDQPPSEIELELQLVQLEGKAAAVGHRVDSETLTALRSDPGASSLASFGLSLVGSDHARLGMPAPSGLPGRMSFNAKAGNPYGTRDVTLRVQFEWTSQLVPGEHQRTERYHNVNETVSLTEGEAIVVPVKIDSPKSALVLIVEPRIVRASALDPAAQESFRVGTETAVTCPLANPLAEALKDVTLVREPEPVYRKVTPGPPLGQHPLPGASGYQGRPIPFEILGEPETERPAETPTPEPDGVPSPRETPD